MPHFRHVKSTLKRRRKGRGRGRAPVYFIMGHGNETMEPFESRAIVPDGYTFVTLSACGDYSIIGDIKNLFDGVGLNEKIMCDPLLNKKKIEGSLGKKIRIYTPGDNLPNISVTLLLDWIFPDNVLLSKSGVIKLPLAKSYKFSREYITNIPTVDLMSESEFPTDEYEPLTPMLKSAIRDLYTDSIFPNIKTIESILSEDEMSLNTLKESLNYSVKTIVDKFGPGVYYIIACRGISEAAVLNRFPAYYNTYTRPVSTTNVMDKIIPLVNHLKPIAEQQKLAYNTQQLAYKTEPRTEKLGLGNILPRHAINHYNAAKKIHNYITLTRKRSNNQQGEILTNTNFE